MTVTVCPRRPRVDDNALTTSERPPLVANGCISDAIITMSRGAAFDERLFLVPFDRPGGAFCVFARSASAAFFRVAGAAPMADVARAAVAGFEAFRGEALGDGSDPDAAGRFL